MKGISSGLRNSFRMSAATASLLALSATAANFTVSPNTVSNNYAGYVTLQVTGITAGHAVQVQEYLDANANGVIDAGDLLRLQYTLTDGVAGQVLGGVTNVNVPSRRWPNS